MNCTGPCRQGRTECPTPQACHNPNVFPEPIAQMIIRRMSIGFMAIVCFVSLLWLLFGS
jgi:hypothetical protein